MNKNPVNAAERFTKQLRIKLIAADALTGWFLNTGIQTMLEGFGDDGVKGNANNSVLFFEMKLRCWIGTGIGI